MIIYSVIVTYNPDKDALIRLCSVLINSKVKIILVDNSEESALSDFLGDNENLTIIPLNSNTGIAYAQNTGIRYALDKCADVVIFFDQDSRIDVDFVPKLLTPIKMGELIIVGPVFFDEQKGFEYPSFKFNSLRLLRKVYSNGYSNPYAVDVIISSGSAVTKEVFAKVALMDEDFFIDFVDIEWSLRCRSMGIPILINPKAVMKHSVGNSSIKVGNMRSFIHSPSRSYYKLRNAFLFFRKKHTPFLLGAKEILAALFHQFLQLFYVDDKKQYFKMYLIAIRDGILGVKGRKKM